jgi:hypothetical protein
MEIDTRGSELDCSVTRYVARLPMEPRDEPGAIRYGFIAPARQREMVPRRDMLNRSMLQMLVVIVLLPVSAALQGVAQAPANTQPPSSTAAAAEAKAIAASSAPLVEPHMIAPPSDEPHQDLFGQHIQRSMTLLATSNKELHRPVRILLYGQSIVGSGAFTKYMGTYFAQRYPFADIQFDNLAIGGFGGDRLVRTAVHDLYPYYPDLMIFHVYAGQRSGEVERIISNVRRYTTSDIILFEDHRTKGQEISDASVGFWRYLAAKYDCELVEVSTEWPRYLKEHNLEPAQMLRDGTHPSVDGYAVLAALVERHLKYNPMFSDPWDTKVIRYEARRPLSEADDEIVLSGDGWTLDKEGIVGSDAKSKLHLEFEGNRVDLVAEHTKGDPGGTARILIDGKPPSADIGTTTISRPSAGPGTWFPAVMRVSHSKPLLTEDWTLKVTRISPDAKDFDYDVTGSKTGPDGSGNSLKMFRSKSGRVVIDPADWMLADIMKIFKETSAPPVGYEVHWKTIPQYVDVYKALPTVDAAKVYATTLAQGLTNGKHTLDILLNGDGPVPIEAIQVYRPPLHN